LGAVAIDINLTSSIHSLAMKPLYESSTQFRNWRYSQVQLENVRATLNAAAVSVIRNNFETDEVSEPHGTDQKKSDRRI
jgi:cellobiose phosphorylase